MHHCAAFPCSCLLFSMLQPSAFTSPTLTVFTLPTSPAFASSDIDQLHLDNVAHLSLADISRYLLASTPTHRHLPFCKVRTHTGLRIGHHQPHDNLCANATCQVTSKTTTHAFPRQSNPASPHMPHVPLSDSQSTLSAFPFRLTDGQCYDPVLPHFIFFTLPLFQSRDLERHLTFSCDLRHMVDHLTSHLTPYHMITLLF